MRFSSFFVLASSLSLVLALPLTTPERRDDSSLSHASRELAVEASLFQRDVLGQDLLEKRAPPKAGFSRVPVTAAQRKTRKETKQGAKAVRVAAAKARGKDRANHRPANAKVTFGADAKRKLDELGLHGKARKHAKNYHKKIVHAEMGAHGATKGRVFHLAHKGGSDPNEKNHLTVGLYDHKGDQIKSPWAVKKEKETGQKTKGLFHMYPENHKIKEPKSFTAAAEKSQERQKAAADAALDASKAEAARKEAAALRQKEAGQSLSAEEKKAQRKAASEAKKAGKKGGPSGP